MKKIALVLSLVAVFALVNVASAATLQEQIAALQAQLAALMAQAGGTAVTSSVPTITKNLTLGSKGDEVEALQKYLEDEGLLEMPAGVDYGYFGPLTKKAVVEWQKANDVSPASGYFGPISRAALEALAATAPATGTTGTTPVVGITTPGAEGTITVTTNPTPSSGLTLREGDVNKDVLGLKLEAKLSDIAVQRVKVDLGASTLVYNKLFKKIYLKDGSTVLAESDLNSSTVVKDGTNYYVTLTGFNVVVPKNAVKVLTLALDAQTSIDSGYDGNASYGVSIPVNGVRGVDGAGLSQTGPASSAISRLVTVDADALVDAATLSIATAASTPAASNVIASDGTSDNEKDGVPFAVFTATVEKDSVIIDDANVTFAKTGSGAATATTAYLEVDGVTIGSASVNSATGVAAFTDMNYSVSAGSTKTITIKADIRSANPTASVIRVSSVDLVSENSQGTSITESGSVSGNSMTVTNSGLDISLLSKSATSIVKTNDTTGVSTTTVEAKFSVKVKALGTSALLGTEASTSPMFASSTTYFVAYQGASAQSLTPTFLTYNFVGKTVSSETVTLGENEEAVVDVTVQYLSRSAAGVVQLTGGAAVGVAGAKNSGTATVYSFMSGDSNWRTGVTAITN